MIYYYVCQAQLIIFFSISLYALYIEYKNKIFSYKNVLLALFLVLIFKYNWGVNFFGLEYEDAYVFSACARMLENAIFTHSFLTDCVAIGSLENPSVLSTYGGHFIMYPVYLSNFISIFGYGIDTIVFANIIVVFLMCCILSAFWGKRNYCWLIAPLLYCCSPIINVFSMTFLSETFSSFICITYLFYWYRFYKTSRNLYFIFSVFAFLTAIMCKRENLILLVIPICYCLFLYLKSKRIDFTSLRYLIVYFSVCAFYLCFIQNVFAIEKIESVDINTATFSFDNFLKLFPYFIKSYLDVNNFSLLFYIFLIAVFFACSQKKFMNIALSLVFLGYFLLYSSHYRGYYFAMYGDMSEFETFRYLNNFFYIISIIVAYYLSKENFKKNLPVFSIFLSAMLVFSFFVTIHSREKYHKIEYVNRIADTDAVIEIIGKNLEKNLLVTADTLVYQTMYPSSLFTYDISLYDENFFQQQDVPIYMEIEDIEHLKERLGVNIQIDHWEFVSKLPTGKRLYKYSEK